MNLQKNIFVLLCLISFIGAIVYRLYALNNTGVIISLILAISVFVIIQRFGAMRNTRRVASGMEQNGKMKIFNIVLAVIYCLLFSICFYILFKNQTDQAIISPWQVVPSYFFAFYSLATVIAAIFIFKQHSNSATIKQFNNLTIFLISLHYFLSFSIAWAVYKIGYGFDPFIHQATMELIDKTGSVAPKPFYYLGQYSIIVILHKITALSIIWIDKLLVPVLAAVYLPITFYRVLCDFFKDYKAIFLAMLILLILPFSFFIATTPQNFAYLLLALVILRGLICKNVYDLIIVYLLALTALATQPIAGIPAMLFAILLSAYYCDKDKIKKYFYSLIFFITIFILPLLFYFIETRESAGAASDIKIIPSAFFNFFKQSNLFKISILNQENFILNFIYFYGFNLRIIIALLFLAGLIIAYRHKKQCEIFFICSLMSFSLFFSYLLIKILPFNFLIDYERNNYTDRILIIAVFFLLPFILTALYAFVYKILKQNRIIKISFLTFLLILISTSLYLSYPRYDHYFNSHGYSASQNDIKAARWIEDGSRNDYIVLANQQVSAAALREFGFKKYYTEAQIFYYPIPTGGPLYQYYLDMVYKKPSRATMLAAMDLTGVDEAYFVLNKYWWAFSKILAEAKLEADGWEKIGDGEVYIFEYNK